MPDPSDIDSSVNPRQPPRYAATLDGFARATNGSGVLVRNLARLTELIVQTGNTRYRVVVSDGADVVVQGGTFFPDPTHGRIVGSSFSGTFLKVGWIGVGFCMEIVADGRRIVTTAVKSIAIANMRTRPASVPSPKWPTTSGTAKGSR